jgi:hypothetical protein
VPTSHRISVPQLLLGVAWMVAVGAGLLAMLRYETERGAVLAPVPRWPADSRLQLDPDHGTLVMLAHPRCPCTRSSIDELAHIMARCQGRASAHVLFFQPADAAADWQATDLWHSASAIPGVYVVADVEGAEAKRFGAATSGHVLLFAPDGRCLFSGGITMSRGHAGDNVGRSTVLALLAGGSPDLTVVPVFGCPLFPLSAAEEK